MIVYSPDFFGDFHCIGSACGDNCCRMGWDIEIDDATFRRYKDLDSKLCRHISDENGEHYIIQENGQCPFLNEEGLCSVLLRHGEENISEICAQHPRFYQWFGGYKEAGTGLCCEESARLWLEKGADISFCSFETDEADDDLEYDPSLLAAVIKARGALIRLMEDKSLRLSEKLKALLIFGLNAQDYDEQEAAEGFDGLAKAFSDMETVKELLSQLNDSSHEDKLSACRQVISCFEELDYMRGDFPAAVESIKGRLGEIISNAEAFDRAFPEAEGQLCAVAVYNIFRYVIECVRGEECLPLLMTAILNVWFIRLCDIMLWLEGKFGHAAQVGAVKEYSKEVEYSDNTDVLREGIYTDSRLNAENIKAIAEV